MVTNGSMTDQHFSSLLLSSPLSPLPDFFIVSRECCSSLDLLAWAEVRWELGIISGFWALKSKWISVSLSLLPLSLPLLLTTTALTLNWLSWCFVFLLILTQYFLLWIVFLGRYLKIFQSSEHDAMTNSQSRACSLFVSSNIRICQAWFEN